MIMNGGGSEQLVESMTTTVKVDTQSRFSRVKIGASLQRTQFVLALGCVGININRVEGIDNRLEKSSQVDQGTWGTIMCLLVRGTV